MEYRVPAELNKIRNLFQEWSVFPHQATLFLSAPRHFMQQYFIDPRFLLMVVTTFLLYSCSDPAMRDAGMPAGNLFGPSRTDSVLFQKPVDSAALLMPPDTAFARSGLVITARIAAIDSLVHGKEQAPFYLITALPDSCLKGRAKLTRQRLYFISYRRLSFPARTGSIICFLKEAKEKNLMQGTGIDWQWLDHAPANTLLAALTIPPHSQKVKRGHRHHFQKRNSGHAAP
jgi:hypothetical protein